MPDSRLRSLGQAQKERLSHIDFKVCFLGAIGRGDLVRRFGIKEAAATRDIALYRNLAPSNLSYDTKAKVYARSKVFESLFEHTPDQVLAALAYGFGDDFVGTHKGFIACETPAQLNKPFLPTLSVLTRAIWQAKAVRIGYSSLGSGRTTREIVPYVLVDNGLRWHVRGYDRRRSKFSDFVITRVFNPAIIDGPIKEHETRESDIQWNRIVEMKIVPHPSLDHPKTIEIDYAMENGALQVNVRAAVAGYMLRRWNVDCTPDHSLKGPEYHLWLKNRQALYGVENIVLAPGYEKDEDEGE
ncbi:MAG: WYL domain-containing protein [Ectothiorhodospiraceae bacterium AqS1]|nr:WYL domain-containing protein [Ectothiorhodospiraceae bacterium AqS1]MBF2761621.1 WYL domain-containing protein [Ectothiorhodospiraceae bacterium AqS1]